MLVFYRSVYNPNIFTPAKEKQEWIFMFGLKSNSVYPSKADG